MHFRIRLPGGIFKIKSARYSRTAEMNREVPVLRIGRHYYIWWPAGRDENDE